MTSTWILNSDRRLRKLGSLMCALALVLGMLVLSVLVLTQNASAGTVPPSTISVDTTWNVAGSPYYIEYDVTVEPRATLTIKPGVEVRFNGSYSLIIDGNLVAIGTEANKIIFTSNFPSPSPEDWQSIRFNAWNTSSNYTFSTIKYAIIEYATYGVHCHNRSIGLENSTVTNNTIGVYSTLASYPYIANNTISNNTQHGIDWSNDLNLTIKVWNHTTNMILNNTISNNNDSGINLSAYAWMLIDGNNIYSNDDGIYLNSSSPMIFNNTITDNENGIYSYNSSPMIGNSTLPGNNIISSNTQDGIYLFGEGPDIFESANAYVSYNNISLNKNGIYGEETSSTIKSNYIMNNAGGNWNGGISLQQSSENIITNNTVSSNYRFGIFLNYSSNNTIADNTALNNEFGIQLSYSSNNTITSNNASSNTYDGVQIWLSDRNMVANNTASSNDLYGIFIPNSTNITITNNSMVSDGLFIGGSKLDEWNTHSIDTANTVNGKPVYYWKNQTSGTIPSGAGEVILANCTGVTVENQNVSDGSAGIELGFSSSNTIINNTVSSNNWIGIYLVHSSSNTIINNTVYSNDVYGIILTYNANDNIVLNSTITGSNVYGLAISASSNDNAFTNSRALSNGIGIYLSNLDNSNISNSNVSSNSNDGIFLHESTSIEIYNNTIGWNGRAGINCTESSSAIVMQNDILNNALYGIWSGSGSNETIHSNTISGHHDLVTGTGFGVYNDDSSIVINATGNWWGHTSGPYDPDDNKWAGGDYNPTGQGDCVRDEGYYIIIYRPWTP